MRRSPRRAWGLAVLLVLSPAGACKEKEKVARTQILVAVDADPGVRMEADRLVVALSRGADQDSLEPVAPENVDLDGDFRWPFTLALVPGSSHRGIAFEVHVTAEREGEDIVSVRARTKFLEGETRLLEMFLADECLGFFDCGADETCIGEDGMPACRSATLDPKDLPPFEVTGNDAGGASIGEPTRDAGPGGSSDAGDGGGGGCEGPERCFNGEDDDCDGDLDCEDADCEPEATCVPEGEVVGEFVPATDDCSGAFGGEEMLLHQGLRADDCAGCECTASAPTCFPKVYTYADAAACTSDASLVLGSLAPSPTSSCSNAAIYAGTLYGWRVGSIDSSGGSCTASGTATLGEPVWAERRKLCPATALGAGCGDGQVCAPRGVAGTLCIDVGGGSCPASTVESPEWYEGFADSRECGDCACDKSGGSCGGVQVEIGSNVSCGTPDARVLSANSKDCSANNFNPSARQVGSASQPTCTPTAEMTGLLQPERRHDLCCVE